MGIPEEVLGEGAALESDCERWVQTVSHAAAVAGELTWLEYEVSPTLARGPIPQLTSFNGSKGCEEHMSQIVLQRQLAAMKKAKDMAANWDLLNSQNISLLGAPVLSTTDLVLSGVLGGRQSGASLPTWQGWQEWITEEELHWNTGGEWDGDDAHQEGCERATRSTSSFWVGAMETKLWIEIDALVRNLRRIDERLPIPPQLLALLPAAPDAGWPPEFMLHLMAEVSQSQIPSKCAQLAYRHVSCS